MARVLLLTSALCCLALALPSPGAAQGAEGVVYAAAPKERGAYQVGAAGGKGHYGYNTGDGIAKIEVRNEDGSVVGSYRYFDPYGKQVVRSYIADENGFRVLGNDLPISLDTPAFKVEGAPALTGAVEGTQDYAIPPPLSPGSARTVQPGSLTQSISEQYRITPRDAEQHVLTPLGPVTQQLVREQQELQAQQLQQMQELQATLIAQQQVNIDKQAETIALQQARYGGPVNNELTHGATSPYYSYPEKYPFDFPAGFAYPGLPVKRQPEPEPVATPRPYIIGKRDPVKTPEPSISTNTTTTTTTTTTTPAPPVVGDEPDHPEVDITSGHTHSEVSPHPPVGPHKGDDPDHPEVDITAGHTKTEVSPHPPVGPHKGDDPDHPEVDITAGHTKTEVSTLTPVAPHTEFRKVDDKVTAGHTHSELVELDPVGTLKHVNHVEDDPIPQRHTSHNIVAHPDTYVRQRPIAHHNPNTINKRPLWNYNEYPFNNRNSYSPVLRPIARQNPRPITQRPLWNYNQSPYVRRQSYERIRPISGRPKLPHCPGWCP